MMKGTFSCLILCFSIVFSAFSQTKPTNVVFFGSSVCKGSGDADLHGYAWQFFHSGAVDTLRYNYINASRGGDNTIKIERDDRIGKDLFPTEPDIVVIGLSLGNEGITKAKDENEKERILEQFRSRVLAMADNFQTLGIKPIIVNCYANNSFEESHYNFTKRMNRSINTWDYPSVNVLGTIDDLEGKWVEGHFRDGGHPNTVGHKEMSYAIVPTLFDALLAGKETPTYDWNRSFATIVNEKHVEKPISIDVEHAMHSFTMSLRFKETADGSIAGFVSTGEQYVIQVKDGRVSYGLISATYPQSSEEWTHVLLSHSYANAKSMLFVNGVLMGSVEERLSPSEVHFGGTAESTELKDLTLYRASLNESEALDLFNKKFIQSSLEFYNPLTKSVDGSVLSNMAQSLTTGDINVQARVIHNEVQF